MWVLWHPRVRRQIAPLLGSTLLLIVSICDFRSEKLLYLYPGSTVVTVAHTGFATADPTPSVGGWISWTRAGITSARALGFVSSSSTDAAATSGASACEHETQGNIEERRLSPVSAFAAVTPAGFSRDATFMTIPRPLCLNHSRLNAREFSGLHHD